MNKAVSKDIGESHIISWLANPLKPDIAGLKMNHSSLDVFKRPRHILINRAKNTISLWA